MRQSATSSSQTAGCGSRLPVYRLLGFKVDGAAYRWLGDRLVREAEFPA